MHLDLAKFYQESIFVVLYIYSTSFLCCTFKDLKTPGTERKLYVATFPCLKAEQKRICMECAIAKYETLFILKYFTVRSENLY